MIYFAMTTTAKKAVREEIKMVKEEIKYLTGEYNRAGKESEKLESFSAGRRVIKSPRSWRRKSTSWTTKSST